MSSPISERAATAVALAFALAACSRGDERRSSPRTVAGATEAAADAEPGVACGEAPHGADQRCAVDRADTARGTVLTIRRPDGGFRRLLIASDGHGVVAADGAEPARVAIIAPTLIEVRVGQEVYQLPATVRRQP